MKKYNPLRIVSLGIVIAFSTLCIASFNSCAPTKAITAKSGVQLWSENCQRCHNTPSPSTFSPEQWETIGLHMQTRALLTESERNKIIDFLKSSR